MNGEISPRLSKDQLQAAQVAANVLNASAEIRAREEKTREQIAKLAIQRAEYEGSAERALASEMWTMANRMHKIVNHPWKARREGKSAIDVVSTGRNQFKTEPVPDGTILMQDGKEFIASGLVYTAKYRTDHWDYSRPIGVHLDIARLIENQNLREASETQVLYDLKTFSCEIGARVEAHSSEFEEHKKQAIDKNVQRLLRGEFENDVAHWDAFDVDVTPPDEMYLDPLTYVIYGNMLLGAKRN